MENYKFPKRLNELLKNGTKIPKKTSERASFFSPWVRI